MQARPRNNIDAPVPGSRTSRSRFSEITWKSQAPQPAIVDATPQLAGAASVGLVQYLATDASRLDSSTGVRQFLTTVRYPARANTGAPRAGLLDLLVGFADSAVAVLADRAEKPVAGASAVQEQLSVLAYRAQLGLKAAGGPHPVLIYYPGGQCHRCSSAGLCESLASFGYVVIAIDAPRDAPMLAFPDGRLVIGPMGDDEDYIWPRIADVRFLLDQLPLLNAKGLLAGQLDIESVAMFGSSRGGYLSNIMAVADERIKSAVNFAGFLWGLWVKEGTGLGEYPLEWQNLARNSPTPVMRLQSEQPSPAATRDKFLLESHDFGGEFIYASIQGLKHGGFAPTPWLCGSVEKCLNLEKAPGFEHYGILLELLSGFFGQHLRKEGSRWLDALSNRPELHVHSVRI